MQSLRNLRMTDIPLRIFIKKSEWDKVSEEFTDDDKDAIAKAVVNVDISGARTVATDSMSEATAKHLYEALMAAGERENRRFFS